MNIKNVLTLAVVLLLSSPTFSQVKKQFQDTTDALTTVVIKDENASDIDILNEFDLEEMGMHQVIRITTEDEIVVDEPTPQVPEIQQTVVEAKPEKVAVVRAEPIVEKAVAEQAVIIKNEKPSNGGIKVNNEATNKTTKYESNSSRRKAFKPYAPTKRFKKKKRKKVKRNKRNSGKCYRF